MYIHICSLLAVSMACVAWDVKNVDCCIGAARKYLELFPKYTENQHFTGLDAPST